MGILNDLVTGELLEGPKFIISKYFSQRVDDYKQMEIDINCYINNNEYYIVRRNLEENK